MKKTGSRQQTIATEIGVTRATISRELRRNAGERGYRPKQAHEKALARRATAKVRIEAAVWKIVEEKLRQDWSPEQGSGVEAPSAQVPQPGMDLPTYFGRPGSGRRSAQPFALSS